MCPLSAQTRPPHPVSSLSHLLCSRPPPSCQSNPLPSSSCSLGTLPRHGPTYGHHSLPQNPSPPSLSKPRANSCARLARSPPVRDAAPKCKCQTRPLRPLTANARVEQRRRHGVCRWESSRNSPGSPFSAPETCITHFTAPWSTGWLQGSLIAGSAARLMQSRWESIRKCNVQSA